MKDTEPRRVKRLDENDMKERSGRRHEMPNPEDIAKIMETISERIPDLLTKLGDVLYGPDQAHKFGKAAAVFYSELKNTGMTDAQIFELTRQYMSTLNIGGMIGEARKMGRDAGKD
jgi:hypothetical protein